MLLFGRSSSSNQLSIISNSFESYLITVSLVAAILKPGRQILALTDIETTKLVATLKYGFNAGAGNSDTSSDGEFAEKQQMQSDTPQGWVGDGRSTE